jgi:hypothetical protein
MNMHSNGAQRRYHTGLRSNPVRSWPKATK